MSSRIRFFSLVVLGLCIALVPSFNLSAQSDTPETLKAGDSVENVRSRAEFLLDAAEGQTVTLRWEGQVRSGDCIRPLEEILEIETDIKNADDQSLAQISMLYTETSTTQVYRLDGSAPYHISARVCNGSNMSLSIIDGNAIAPLDQPALSIGQTAQVSAPSVGEDHLLRFPLNVQAGDVFTVKARLLDPTQSNDFPIYAAVIRDKDGHIVASDFSDQLPPELIVTAPVYTVTGAIPYQIEFPALPLYYAGYAKRFGEVTEHVQYSVELQSGNTVIEDAGLLKLDTPAAGTLSPGKPVIYTLDVAENETITVHLELAQGSPGYYFLDANGNRAGTILTATNNRNKSNRVMKLEGPTPYRYYFDGQGSYTLMIEAGDTLERKEHGTLAPGGVLRVTIPPPNDALDYITLDATPESTVTLNWGMTQTEYVVEDSAGNTMYPTNDQWNDGYAVIDLSQGTPPFVISIDDARYAGQAFTFTLAEGETPLAP